MSESPRSLIKRLLDIGMTEVEIVDELRKVGVDTTQATINRIKTGDIKRTSFDIGMGLVRLHDQRSTRPAA